MYYIKNGLLVKVVEVNGDYSVRFQTFFKGDRLHLIMFGAKEFFQNTIKATGIYLMIAQFSGL